MGNMMFQIAACIATSLRYNIPYCIPMHTLNDKVWKPIYYPNVNYCDVNNVVVAQKEWKQPSHSYTEIPKPNRSVVLDGYFQSQKFFIDYIDEIRNAFGFNCSVKNKGVVALHKRLADYKLYPDKHHIISDEYIEKSLRYLSGLGYCKCLIFSDEIGECKGINSKNFPMWEFEYSEGRTETEDFQLMLNCESFIISASTFSLMASILSESENKICIAPKKWFEINNSHLDTKDIVPEKYIRL